jgi:hypothetical protein
MVVSHNQDAGQNHNILIANKSLKNVAKFKYFGTTVTNKNCSHKEMNSRLNMEMLAAIFFRIICLPITFLKT